jgi:ArsR family transcriptional regulator, cadmium/lead-responsive transcriptional repressor
MTISAPTVENGLEVEVLTRFFQVLADPTRVRIVELLLEGEKNVTELVQRLGVPQARVSSHLGCLRWCGYIGTRREGKFVYYRITNTRVEELMRLARTIMADNAETIASCLRLNEET